MAHRNDITTNITTNITNQATKSLKEMQEMGKAKLIKFGVYFVSTMLIILLFVWSYTKFSLKDSNCAKINQGNDDAPSSYIEPLVYNNPMIDGHQSTQEITDQKLVGDYKLRDFVVKTAYNCCATGGFSHDYVGLCALENCIDQRARCLDFEIYNFNNKPIIAVSTINRHNIKETYNALDFGLVMEKIKETAFTSSITDPLFLHFRIKTKNKAVLDEMANSIFNNFSDRLLSSQYSYEYNNQSIGDVKMSILEDKIIIMVSKINDDNTCSFDGGEYSNTSPIPLEESKLYEYVNIITGSNNMNVYRNSNAKVGVDRLAVMEHNKKKLGMVLPDCTNNPSNYDWIPFAFKDDEDGTGDYTQLSYGFQFIGLSFQSPPQRDEYLNSYHKAFNDKKSSFILKPEMLRHMDATVSADLTQVNSVISNSVNSHTALLNTPFSKEL